MTLTQKIIASKSGQSSVRAGQIVRASVDVALANDITAPVSIRELEKFENKVCDPDRVVFVLDHFTPNKDIKSAENCRFIRDFCSEHGIEKCYHGAEAGIEHALLPEQGLVLPGQLILGADSHTCTYGALNAFSTGVGSTDLAVAIKTGECWLKVPSAIKIVLAGNFRKYVSGKDLILHIIGLIGVDGAAYRSIEFCGDTQALSIDDKFTVCNMGVEAGAKNCIFPADETVTEYVQAHNMCGRPYRVFEADPDAEYEKTIYIDLSELDPVVAYPHLPSNIKSVYDAEKDRIRLDQVVIGSCTNGRYSDLEAAADILRGKKVSSHVRTIIIPATPEIYKKAIKNGLMEVFTESGCIISPPTCGPCLGGFMGILADTEKCASTTNRNFVGRMGHTGSEVYLCSPAVAAQSAVEGIISAPKGDE